MSAYAETFDTNRSRRRRAGSFGLAIAAHILVILLLFRLAPQLQPRPVEERHPVSFQMLPDADNKQQPKTQVKAVAKVKTATASGKPTPVVTPNPPPPAKTPPTPPVDLSLFGNRSLFASSDIGKIHNAPSESDGTDDGSGKDSVAAYGPGAGPGGQHYYNVEWYREPTHTELATYLPHDAPPTGWGEIACRTIEHYHVDNCRTIGESPLGSGFARSLREAAWQFLVRPPRIGGKRLVGSWVNIRIDWTEQGPKQAR